MKVIFTIKGNVIQGKGRGKQLGFPTANIKLNKNIPEGIYASVVIIDEIEYLAATFIGAAKTFNESERKAESYILDFSEDLYGMEIEINLYELIRNNQAFSSKEELVKQIGLDIEKVKKYFALT